MIRLPVFAALLALSLPALAQSKLLEVKGVPLGATKAQMLASLNESSHCIDVNQIADAYDSICGNSDPTGGPPDTFAGQSTAINYYVLDDLVGEITVAYLRADNYAAVLDALTAKYGQPNIEHPTTQTKGGTTFENTVATWKQGNDEIVYDRYGRTLQYSWLRFTSGSYATARKQWQASQTSDAVNDM